jgi:hypothetical protein
LGFASEDAAKDALALCAEIEKMLVALISKLRARTNG